MSVPIEAEQWCELCDLPQWTCIHANGTRPPANANLERLETIGATVSHLIPWRVSFDASGYRRYWSAPVPEVIKCEGHEGRSPDLYLCRECAEAFRLVLEDVPALLHDLDLALTRQAVEVDLGAGHETPLPYDEGAAECLEDLGTALGASVRSVGGLAARSRALTRDWASSLSRPHVAALAGNLSEAVARAHRVIDRPAEPWYYGPCPECGADLYDERTAAYISCPDCGYAANRQLHQLACLTAGEDRLLTVTELVGAITSAGETVTRDQINGWIRRDGLVREAETRQIWRDGAMVEETVWVYRLGDVRLKAQEADDRRAG